MRTWYSVFQFTSWFTVQTSYNDVFGWFKKKCCQSVTLGVKIQTIYTPMKPMQFICGNIVFSEYSKFLSHMSHIFLRILIQVTFSAIFQYEQCYNTLIIENSQRMNRSCIVAYTTWHILKTLFYDKWVMLDAFMHNLHCFSNILTLKFIFYLQKLMLPSETVSNYVYFHWLIVLKGSTVRSYYKLCCCRENGAWKMPLICQFLSHSGHFIATKCGNISMFSMSFFT